MATLRYFAAAAEAAGTNSEHVDAGDLATLRNLLIQAHGADFERVLNRCAVLIDGVRADSPTTPIAPGSLIDVLPPFAGG